MLVEDDLLNRKILNRMLVKAGCEPVDAHNGAHALALMAQQAFDIVLMDWQMPVMDGLECTRRLRLGEGGTQGLTVPIIALTASAFSENRDACLAAGMNDFLTKPIQAELLRSTVAHWAAHIRDVPSKSTNTVDMKPTSSGQITMANDNQPDQPLAYDASILPSLLGSDETSAELEYQVIREFVRSWPFALEAIERALATGDTRALRMQIHTLKSTSSTIGALEISQLTITQDARLAAGETTVENLVTLLTALFERFQSALALHRASLA